MMADFRVSRTLLAIASLSAPAALWGCAAPRDAHRASPGALTPLTPADFVGPADASDPVDRSAQDAAPPPRRISAERASEGVGDVVVLAGAPPLPSAPPAPGATETRYLVDQMVGQINGKPVYANEFFSDMDARLRQEVAKLKTSDEIKEWFAGLRKEIEQTLWDRLRDDLLLAEFEASMTPEQRMGLLAFVESVRQNFISTYGSEATANERLLSEQGKTLDQTVSDTTQLEFVREQLRRSIISKVQVSYREVENYYQRHPQEFTVPASATFRIIRVPASDTALVAEVERALASGESPIELARRLSTYKPDEGSVYTVELKAPLAESTIFQPQPLDAAARALSVGRTSPRIDFANDAWWLHLESLTDAKVLPLYEVQRAIEAKLRNQRISEEERAYFTQLLAKSSVSDIQTMVQRLHAFAAERYLLIPMASAEAPPETAEAPPGEGK